MHDSPIFGRFAGVISRHAAAIIGLLMLVAGGLMASAPNLEELALTHGSPMMPTNTQSAAALKHMAKAFGESESNNTAAVVVVKDQPFTEQDRQFRADLMKKLRADTEHVEPGMDMWSDPQF
ncbi:MMPL family transporter, partial [Staphylococcus capitis]|nr:MMPL family transporter [Staphylococcus capitis]